MANKHPPAIIASAKADLYGQSLGIQLAPRGGIGCVNYV